MDDRIPDLRSDLDADLLSRGERRAFDALKYPYTPAVWERTLQAVRAHAGGLSNSLCQLSSVARRYARRNEKADEFCEEVSQRFSLDLSALQIACPDTVETIGAAGMARAWAECGKHRRDRDPKHQDIHDALLCTGGLEIVNGFDQRFDRFIYDQFNHAQLSRVFLTIAVVRDQSGVHRPDLHRECTWSGAPLRLTVPVGCRVQFIGTFEAGRANGRLITVDEARRIAAFIQKRALDVYALTFDCLNERILGLLAQTLSAESATMHVLDEEQSSRDFGYRFDGRTTHRTEVCSTKRGGLGGRPRPGGLGALALKHHRPYVVHGKALRRLNEIIYHEDGVRTLAVIPFSKDCLLYFHFYSQRQIAPSTWDDFGKLLNEAELLLDDVRQRALEREQAAREKVVLSALLRLEQRRDPDIDSSVQLEYLLHAVRNALTADLVMFAPSGVGDFMPIVAGRLRRADLLRLGQLPALGSAEESQYVSNGSYLSQLFCEETVRAYAALPVPVGRLRAPATLVFCYRVPHDFGRAERELLESLARLVGATVNNNPAQVRSAAAAVSLKAATWRS
jgi:hypothetical protein